MTYAEAQMIIDDPNRQDPLAVGCRNLNMLAKKLKARRIEAGYANSYNLYASRYGFVHVCVGVCWYASSIS